MITNDEVEIVSLKGKIEGLTSRLDALIRISNRDDYRGDLSKEIERVESEIKNKLEKINNINLKNK